MTVRKSRWWGALGAVFVLAAAPAGAGQTIINDAARYPEGPVAADGGVYYAEMGSDRVMFWADGETREFWRDRRCGPTSVAVYRNGFLVLCHIGGAVVRVSHDGRTLAIVTHATDGRKLTDPNASTSDARGGVYFSSSGQFSPTAPSEGEVFYLDRLGGLRRVADGIHYSNGVALSPDGATLYVSEHLSRNVLAYDVAEDGGLSNGRVYLKLDDLVGADPSRAWDVGPDGLATDAAGNLYIAEYGAGHLLIVGTDRTLKATIEVPETYVTAPALTSDEATIFVTAPSARDSTRPGRVYAFDNPVAGG